MNDRLFLEYLDEEYGITAEKANVYQLHNALAATVMKSISQRWKKAQKSRETSRKACYFSAEFLVGRAVFDNLNSLGLTEEAEKLFSAHGRSLSELEEIEDAALGNGGLGRLAACFMESAATMNIPLDGYGIRYKFGLFKQSFVDGFQHEEADDWTRFGDPWSVRSDRDSVIVKFSDITVKAVPYDMPIIGFKTDNIGTLRLWQAEPVQDFDFKLFNEQNYLEASRQKVIAEDISRCLYPNDNGYEGKKLRLRQQYFFCAASIADIVKKHKQAGFDLETLDEKVFVQLNDTHPVISIPELIRTLMSEGISFGKALEIAKKAFGYTNHTIMAEALEKWDVKLVEEILPDIYSIILQISEALMEDLYGKGLPQEEVKPLQIVRENQVHMANMAIYCSAYLNGVAEIHTDILKNDVFKAWYKLYPDKFQNKTNGITPRRWLALCNRELSSFITEKLDGDDWKRNLSKLSELEKYSNDIKVLNSFAAIKKEKKVQLASFIESREGIRINPDSIFDIQIKRLHEYKRQLLNAFGILDIYFGIKDGTVKNFYPTTFIFGAKSAPGYARAKGIIKFINEISKLISADSDVNELMQVVFVQNYNVSYGEKLFSAADVSEQISTAGTEASGTGNMKFMLNGTVTLGTLDGANVEIVAEAGEENNYIFGATVSELEKIMPSYSPRTFIAENPRVARVLRTLIDGTVSDGGTGIFRELYFSLLDGASWHKPDNYYVLGDLPSYTKTRLRLNSDYANNNIEYTKKCWINMCKAGKFSSDRTIEQYAKEIWKL